jgi:molecular chaperone IbpA
MYTTKFTYKADQLDKFLSDVEKYSIGMDEWLHRFSTLHETSGNYPPYNLVKESSVEFRLEIAVAGISKEDIEVSTEWNKLHVESKAQDQTDVAFMHHGIAKRGFKRSWTLSDDVEVYETFLQDGLLTIKLRRVIPEHQKKKVYEL